MPIDPIPQNIVHLFNNEPVKTATSNLTGTDGNFADILTEAISTARENDAVDKGSMLELLMGESDDLSHLLIDAQKAELSLQLALQIRNKVIDAYNEVMRMSV